MQCLQFHQLSFDMQLTICLLDVIPICEPKETISGVIFNVMSKYLTLISIHWTKMCGHRLTTNLKSGRSDI